MRAGKKTAIFYSVFLSFFLTIVFFGNNAITTFSEKIPIDRGHCIIIDAGHGGIDGGATSCSGILESKYNLQIALRLNDLLHLMGHNTKMIRTTDVSVYTKGDSIAQKKASDLKERVRIVNESENGILISIHQNNFSDSRYSGAQVFHGNSEDSNLLARLMQDQLVSNLNPGSNRECKESNGIYLMEHIKYTGILIECGFLSNPEEEAKLRSENYQKNLCCVISAVLSQYLSNT